MKFKFLRYATILFAGLSMITVACSKDSDNDGPDNPTNVTLSVSPTDMTLTSEKGSSTSFNITTNSQWNISYSVDWLLLSSTSGNGNSTITVTALSNNDSSSPRTAVITVNAGGTSVNIMVSQIGSLVGDLSLSFSDMLVLDTSLAFHISLSPNVSYYYIGLLDAAAVAWTDDRIVSTLETYSPLDSAVQIIGADGLNPSTTYVICAIPYNNKGLRGDLIKQTISTPASYGNAWVDLRDFLYSDNYWMFTADPDGFTSYYYMAYWQGAEALARYGYCAAELGLEMKVKIDNGTATPLARGEDWKIARDAGATYFCIASWGVNSNGQLSSQINNKFLVINETKGESLDFFNYNVTGVKIHPRTATELDLLRNNLKVVNAE